MNRKQSRNFDFIQYFIRVVYFKNLSLDFSYRYIYVFVFDLYHANVKCNNLKPSADIVTIREREREREILHSYSTRNSY